MAWIRPAISPTNLSPLKPFMRLATRPCLSAMMVVGIELTVGSNSIKIDPTGITIDALMVKVNGQIQTQVSGLMTQLSGSAMTQISAAITMIG